MGKKSKENKKNKKIRLPFGHKDKQEEAAGAADGQEALTDQTDNPTDSDASGSAEGVPPAAADDDAGFSEGLDTAPSDDAGDGDSLIDSPEAGDRDDGASDGEVFAPSQKDRKKHRFSLFGHRQTAGEKKCPRDPAESSKPLLHLYNELVRHAYDMSTEAIDRRGLSDKEIAQVFAYVHGDYPQLFWVKGYAYTPDSMLLRFRCLGDNDDGTPDKRVVNGILKKLNKARKPFLQGLSAAKKKDAQYAAILKLYRRLVLTVDYDNVGLDNNIDKNDLADDVLRSLRGALIEHKCVCAGYAVAAQYLMQCLRIKVGYVCSESNAQGDAHAFNMINIGKTLYYLDVTWGDSSKTSARTAQDDLIMYDYFCVPYREFRMTSPENVAMHIPDKKMYPMLREYNSTEYEYYRRIGAFVTTYDEKKLAGVFAQAAKEYASTRNAAQELGRFAVSFRCPNPREAESVRHKLHTGGLTRVLQQAEAACKGNKKAVELLKRISLSMTGPSGAVLYYMVPPAEKAKDSK